MMLTGLRRSTKFEGTPEYTTSRLPDRSLVANALNSGGSEAQSDRKAGARGLNSRRSRELEVATRSNSQTVCRRKTQIRPGIVGKRSAVEVVQAARQGLGEPSRGLCMLEGGNFGFDFSIRLRCFGEIRQKGAPREVRPSISGTASVDLDMYRRRLDMDVWET